MVKIRIQKSKNKVVKLSGAFILSFLVLLNISAFASPLHGQKQTPVSVKFLVRTSQNPNAFLSVWDTIKTSSGSSSSNQVRLPLVSDGIYNFFVEWGDNSNDTITIWDQTAVTHTYASAGVYNITITGMMVGWRFDGGGDRLKILEINQWGCLRLGNFRSYFYGCQNLELIATDSLNLTGTTSLYGVFRDCQNLGSSGNINSWDVSRLTTMQGMFYKAFSFNQPIDNWNVSSVTSMFQMFYEASLFNQSIGSWDVSSVTDMRNMFYMASTFNQSLDSWNISNVTTMYQMFYKAFSFNKPLGSWNVSNVTNMRYMFYEASSFNQPIGNWNISSVTDMRDMFTEVTLSTPNNDSLLLGWSQLSLQTGVVFDGGNQFVLYNPHNLYIVKF